MTGVHSEAGVLAGDEQMLIDGELQHTGSGATFDVIHPASEEVAGQATDGTVADMERAVGAARKGEVYNPMQLPGMSEVSYCGGYYHHELVRTPDGWRSRSLREESVWFVNKPSG